MQVPVCDLKAAYAPLREELLAAVAGALDSMELFLGPNVRALEEEWAAYCGTQEAVGLGSGTDALLLGLRALGVGAGDEVITPAFTFFATIEAILHVGARPVMVDIDPLSYCVDPAHVKAALSPGTAAIIPVDLYGQTADMAALRTLAAARGLPLLEDAAQAHGAENGGRRAGALGTIGAFSFYFTKNLGGYGEGGAVTTDDPQLARAVRELRNHGEESKYVHTRVGYNARLDEVHAAMLRVKLRHLDAWNEARRAHAARYSAALADLDLRLPAVAPYGTHVYHLYVIRTARRDELSQFLTSRGIGHSLHYRTPVHLQPAVADYSAGPGSLPVTEQVARECLALPMYAELTEGQQDYVVAAVREFHGRTGS